MPVNATLAQVTQRIIERSRDSRGLYLKRLEAQRVDGAKRARQSCANLAHAFAAAPANDKLLLREQRAPNVAIVSAYNDMLSAHQPLQHFPEIIKRAVREAGATAQFAGGVPAMCDGVTQGTAGMELSLWSRDVIAQATAVALSHDVFDAALMLGVCDKIVPGLLIGALTFGHIPTIFVPAGPMTSGLSNDEKAKVRQLYAEGKVGREELLEAEAQAYHGAGTCTFYGTANSNQMLMEVMGLHLPGSAFINPGTGLRDALTAEAARRAVGLTKLAGDYTPIGHVIDERAIVNGIVGLLATGGSTNHTIHLVAIARAAGVIINWTDFSDLSAVVPSMCRIYPNGKADVNHFHAAGGLGFVIRELLDAGLLHEDVKTVAKASLRAYAQEPTMENGALAWKPAPARSLDETIVRPVATAFTPDGGMKLMQGNLGRAIFKASAVKPEHRVVEAPCRIFHDQAEMQAAFRAGELDRDVVVVVRYQGPRANGMPELHKLTPPLAVLQDRGFKVALVTDGRMSGASGKVPAAIHVSPEALVGGPLRLLRDGDVVRVNGDTGELQALVNAADWAARNAETPDLEANSWGCGRELFAISRANALTAEEGAVSWMA
ncbi:phosphogluconate dehydratase [Piscinibacterium candidicorallinum]|jgi:phosphogluconate dehydratase|uniref:Phosphogluconate dehydratase n=1 Tax=Piscinibacterium candidicorallinum TaxID=1793872 RepID=A0ABV7H3H8_9BURK